LGPAFCLADDRQLMTEASPSAVVAQPAVLLLCADKVVDVAPSVVVFPLLAVVGIAALLMAILAWAW
jgi:hypothetical protein